MQASFAVHQGYHVTTQGLQHEKINQCVFLELSLNKALRMKKYFSEEAITAESDGASLHVEDQRRNGCYSLS